MKRISIRKRLMYLTIALTTLPIITVTWIATINTQKSVEKEMISANYSRMQWADQYLSELIDQINTLFTTLQINQDIMTPLDQNNSGWESGFNSPSLRKTLTSTFFSNLRKVDYLTLYSQSKKEIFTVSYEDSGTVSPLDITKSLWQRTAIQPVNMYFKQTNEGISAYHSINRFPDKFYFGGISVGINQDVWKEAEKILRSESESDIFIMNDEGEHLSGSSSSITSPEVIEQIQSMNLPQTGVVFRQSKDYLYFMESVGDGQLSIVKVIPVSLVKASALPTIKAGIFTGGIFALISIILSILFSLRISRPIVDLARSMQKTNVLKLEPKLIQSFDEVGLLQHGYNSMITKIKELIEHEYQHEIEIKNAQLMALQAQINPHFMNNTLNLIGGMALVKGANEIYTISSIMGDMLRYSISSGDMNVMLCEEIKHIQNYLFIQEQRFSERFNIKFEVDPDIEHYSIPKFILQPLVENAFEHGLQPKRGKWELEIRIRKIKGRLLGAVKDNGMGMTRERLNEMRMRLQSEGNDKLDSIVNKPETNHHLSIGLSNVHTRVRLHYGNNYGIRMFSSEGEGTIILLILPTQN